MGKEKVINLLNELKDYRELAEGMIALIEAGFMDKETYQNTLFMISTAIKQMPEGEEKSKLQLKLSELKSDSSEKSE